MGILGSALGRAIAGGAQAAGQMANKYVDEELSIQRAQALADIQRVTAGKIREDEDAFANDPARVARNRTNKVADITAEGTARNDVALAGERSRATDAPLQEALRKNDTEAAKSKATAEAEIAKKFGNDPLYLKAQRNVAQAKHIESSDSAARAELARMEIKDRQRLGKLYDDLATLEADQTLKPEQKLAKAKTLMSQITAIKAKNAPAAARDPELDTETVTTEEIQPDGTVKKVVSKQVRRPGASPGAPSEDPLKAAMDKARAAKAAAKPTQAAPAPAGEAAPAAAPAPAVPSDPLAGKSRSQIREIEAQLRSELNRWRGKPGAERRAQEIEALLERIANGQY